MILTKKAAEDILAVVESGNATVAPNPGKEHSYHIRISSLRLARIFGLSARIPSRALVDALGGLMGDNPADKSRFVHGSESKDSPYVWLNSRYEHMGRKYISLDFDAVTNAAEYDELKKRRLIPRPAPRSNKDGSPAKVLLFGNT